MPELPEVETTRRGILPYVEGFEINEVRVRFPTLRIPVPDGLENRLVGRTVTAITRRAKYLCIEVESVRVLWHLGMSGSLRLVAPGTLPRKHDHIDWVMSSGWVLRYHDPRRFGLIDLVDDWDRDPRLARLGPEPLDDGFTAQVLFDRSRGKRVAVKNFIMDNAVVVGVGNIYANEALFMSRVDPRRPAGELELAECQVLCAAIRQVLAASIEQGGTTLRDFVSGTGEPGYFAQRLYVYGRRGETCRECGTLLEGVVIGQRATVFCPTCQH
ncbi:bifunctional DNA-formamidopyrimidine glycosylase/DNA-(apurinic or apyrimidinic site) lyase [Larsenimonas rhizosphaerae]|uniref:Formamidopyrimidine-DNA glycosylase n=1 Tax=Larsenimonas rhizosphaerae TaxID=2944682 RepID=A0AA42CUS7_9GAMM|nr:bifunctional DNA-formamidopyrimidine glycosylase/DNA-(apurinic or apyrimidinic site) lyase [Larsenimonas rhizosphaerae]MCM2129643.1 bifunctional DNA-formamidopyrimidine glycosylase/DNA-(apurinic or apyrimidinic site) lyase [Larsenimonas rhizosphaerae]MCX2524301.1 bifunctional DNA-formamidopyrimidine glycosylase/DNA-(apurinic or apyrimidinic site) lyase [Larsenimonas rhizosphaerae]